MIELHNDELVFTFPDLRDHLHKRACAWIDARVAAATSEEKARLPVSIRELYARFDGCIPKVRAAISFQRTLRIPDDGKDYPLPPGLGRFPVRHVDDFADVPEPWKKHGGVMLPIHKTEALWLRFLGDYPMALKVGAGGICAVSGERWTTSLRETPQNYAVLPYQSWLDGFRVSREVVRQFVAMPLGKGLTVEHQLTGEESWGGLQLQTFPYREEEFWSQSLSATLNWQWAELMLPPRARFHEAMRRPGPEQSGGGLGAGGRMKQEIIADPYGIPAWDTSQSSRCFVHLCLADDWLRLTGTPPPHQPPTAQDYTKAGLPWFDYENNQPAVKGTTALSGVKSVNTLVADKTGLELPANATITPTALVKLKPRPSSIVREF